MAAEDSRLDGQRAVTPILRERWGRAWGRGKDSPGGRYGFREKKTKGGVLGQAVPFGGRFKGNAFAILNRGDGDNERG
ncbi:hypothetical protein ACFX19_020427 [Malus domestica]